MPDSNHTPTRPIESASITPLPSQPYEPPRLERFGTFRDLTLAGGGGNCDPSLILGPETGKGTNMDRCYE